MARFLIAIIILICAVTITSAQKSQYLIDIQASAANNKSLSYYEVMDYYRLLAAQDNRIKINEAGPADGYNPIHSIIIDKDKDFDPVQIRKRNKLILLINNGIHPGEPDGIDASLWLVQDLLNNKYPEYLNNIVFVIIPVYNIEGALIRNNHLRFTQNGPEEYGFRGNGQNLDLNRDFIKCDSRNAQTFCKLFSHWDPDVFIDNHVSDGADFQHVMSLLPTQPDKLGYDQGKYFRAHFLPELYRSMAANGFPMTPYVNVWGTTPDQGLPGFMDSPRYASGYAALFNTYAFVPETHMLKPYLQRVQATYTLMKMIADFSAKNKKDLLFQRTNTRKEILEKSKMPISWIFDKSKADTVLFLGYESSYIQSLITDLPRLKYDRTKPYAKKLPYYNYSEPAVSIDVPQAYLIPQGWYRVIERLQMNGVMMQRLSTDTLITATTYIFDNVNTPDVPYEGHYGHSSIALHAITQQFKVHKGDYLIPTMQIARRLIVETLEPQAPDSYFVWNFFDAILNRKEGFNDYVWEDRMAAELIEHPEWKNKLKDWLISHPESVKDGFAQLNYLYQISEYSEPWANQYPVLKIFNSQ